MVQTTTDTLSRSNEVSLKELRNICRSVSALSHVKDITGPGFTRLQDTTKDLQRLLVIIKDNKLSRTDLDELSEDILHSIPLTTFLETIGSQTQTWKAALIESIIEMPVYETDALRKAVNNRARSKLAKTCYATILRINCAVHNVMATTLQILPQPESLVANSHEEELEHYDTNLTTLLLHKGETCPMSSVTNEEWKQAENCLRSLEDYLRTTKIQASTIIKVDLCGLTTLLMRSFNKLDRDGMRQKVDVKCAETCWGLVDKIGSGVEYLLHVASRKSTGTAAPTTASIFFLKSAPPAQMKFTTSRDAWREKKLTMFKDRFRQLVLDDAHPITANAENTWSLVYRELENLEQLFIHNDISKTNVHNVKLDLIVSFVNEKIETLLTSVDQSKLQDEYIFMLISLELGMRVMANIRSLHD